MSIARCSIKTARREVTIRSPPRDHQMVTRLVSRSTRGRSTIACLKLHHNDTLGQEPQRIRCRRVHP